MHPGNRLQPLCPQLSLQAFWPSGPLLPRCPGSGREEAELWVAGSRSRFLLCGWCPGGCECGLGYGSRLCSLSGAPSSAACGVFAREPPPTPDPGGEVDRGMEAGKRGRREPLLGCALLGPCGVLPASGSGPSDLESLAETFSYLRCLCQETLHFTP